MAVAAAGGSPRGIAESLANTALRCIEEWIRKILKVQKVETFQNLRLQNLSYRHSPHNFLGVLLGCQIGARWCLASSLTCDFNMIKNYTHDWLLLVAAYRASSSLQWGC